MKKILLFMLVTLIGFAANAATVYFENTANWSKVYMYTWTDGNNNGAWPGKQVTETVTKDGHTYYKAETNFNMVIFNSGSGQQIKDAQVVDGMIYNANGATNETFSGGTVEIEDTVFLAGNFNNYGSSDSAYQFTKAADGTYTLHLDSFAATSDFKVVYNGTWYGYVSSSLESGKTYTLGDTGTANSKLTGAATNVTFTYNPKANSLKVDYTVEGGSVVTPTTHNVYLAGNFNEFNGSDAAYKFTEAADGTYTLHLDSFAASNNFKVVCDGSWYGYTLGAVESGVEYTLYDSYMENSALSGAATDVTFVYNADKNSLKVTYTVEGGNTPEPGEKNVYLAGNFNEYTPADSEYRFTLGEDGLYTLHLDSFAADYQFKVICDGTWWGYTLGAVESGVAYTLYDSYDENCKLSGAATDVTFVYNADKNSLKVTYTVSGVVTPEPEVRDLYIVGENYGNWKFVDEYKMTQNGNVYTIDLPNGLTGIWKISNKDWSYNFGADNKAGALTKGSENEVWYNSTSDFNTNFAGKVQLKLTIQEGSDAGGSSIPALLLVDEDTSGVEAVETAEAEAEYFTLQGVKVANPANGIYVKVANGKAAKVLVK